MPKSANENDTNAHQCDEGQPGCNVCKRRGLECSYKQQQPNHAPTTPDSANGGVAVPRQSSSGPKSASTCSSPTSPLAAPSTIGVLETELMQHYLGHSVSTFHKSSASSQEVWRSLVPALAYGSDTIRYGMLTLAALCLLHDTQNDPERAYKYLQTAEYYGEQFVEGSSKQMRELKPVDIDSNLVCARLLTVLGCAWFRVHQHLNGVSITEAPAWTWMHLLRGAGVVHLYYRDSPESMREVLAKDLVWSTPYCAGEAHSSETNAALQLIKSTREERFAALYNAVAVRASSMNESQAEAARGAISTLEMVTSLICSEVNQTLMRSILIWPSEVSKTFVEMLIGGELLALAIHAHWLMLVVLVQEAWYMDDMGRHGLREIFELCDAELPADVERSLLEWPRRMLSVCDNSVQGDGGTSSK